MSCFFGHSEVVPTQRSANSPAVLRLTNQQTKWRFKENFLLRVCFFCNSVSLIPCNTFMLHLINLFPFVICTIQNEHIYQRRELFFPISMKYTKRKIIIIRKKCPTLSLGTPGHCSPIADPRGN